MKRFLFILLVCCLIVLQAGAQGSWEWVKSVPAVKTQNTGVCAVSDAQNHIYIAGADSGIVNFGGHTITTPGTYVVKYDNTGNVLWAISGATNVHGSLPLSMVIDSFGHEYLLGNYDSVITFGTHTLAAPAAGGSGYYIAKLDSAGNTIWLKNIGNACVGINRVAYNLPANGGHCLSVDARGNVYVICAFQNNPTIDTFTFTNANGDSTQDFVVTKYDSSGNLKMARAFGGDKDDFPAGICVGKSGNMYFSGYSVSNAITFGTHTLDGAWTFCSWCTYTNLFTVKMDTAANIMWVKDAGPSGFDYLTTMAMDTSEGIYVAGLYDTRPLSFDTFTLGLSPSQDNAFIASYDSAGNATWASRVAGMDVMPWCIGIDHAGDIWMSAYIGGWWDTVNIDGHTITKLPGNGQPLLLVEWSDTGTYIQSALLEDGGGHPTSFCFDNCNNVFQETNFTIDTIGWLDTFQVANQVFRNYPNLGSYNYLVKYDPGLPKATIALSGPATAYYDSTTTVTAAVSSPGSAYVINWYMNGVLVATTTSPTYSYTQTGAADTITAVVVPSVMCYDTAGAQHIVTSTTYISGIAGTNLQVVTMYPNPAHYTLTLTGGPITTVTISNLLGQQLKCITCNTPSLELNIADLLPGIYLVRINNGEVRKLVVE